MLDQGKDGSLLILVKRSLVNRETFGQKFERWKGVGELYRCVGEKRWGRGNSKYKWLEVDMCSRNRKSGGSGVRAVVRSNVRDGGGRAQRWPLICLLSVEDLRILDISYKQACAMSPFGSASLTEHHGFKAHPHAGPVQFWFVGCIILLKEVGCSLPFSFFYSFCQPE